MVEYTWVLTDVFFHALKTPEVETNTFGVIVDEISLYERKTSTTVMDGFDSQV